MFVGHYAVSLALKKVEPKASLGLLFLAVQFLDILFLPFVLLGIERINLIENYTASTHFELIFMPYSHGLFATVLWAVAIYALFRFIFKKGSGKGSTIALVLGLAVFSHWVLDLIVHTPDLPLLGDESLKVGFGLWNNAMATYFLEAVFLLGGFWLYLRATKGTSFLAKYGMLIFVIVLFLVNIVNVFGPPMGDSRLGFALFGLALYLGFAGVAFWLDTKRT